MRNQNRESLYKVLTSGNSDLVLIGSISLGIEFTLKFNYGAGTMRFISGSYALYHAMNCMGPTPQFEPNDIDVYIMHEDAKLGEFQYIYFDRFGCNDLKYFASIILHGFDIHCCQFCMFHEGNGIYSIYGSELGMDSVKCMRMTVGPYHSFNISTHKRANKYRKRGFDIICEPSSLFNYDGYESYTNSVYLSTVVIGYSMNEYLMANCGIVYMDGRWKFIPLYNAYNTNSICKYWTLFQERKITYFKGIGGLNYNNVQNDIIKFYYTGSSEGYLKCRFDMRLGSISSEYIECNASTRPIFSEINKDNMSEFRDGENFYVMFDADHIAKIWRKKLGYYDIDIILISELY